MISLSLSLPHSIIVSISSTFEAFRDEVSSLIRSSNLSNDSVIYHGYIKIWFRCTNLHYTAGVDLIPSPYPYQLTNLRPQVQSRVKEMLIELPKIVIKNMKSVIHKMTVNW